MESATKICFLEKFPESGSIKISNTRGQRPKTFEVDLLLDAEAVEIKWRDATTDGDHITKEHTRILAVTDHGYTPIRVMFYYPNRAQAIKIQQTLETLYRGVGGSYYYGDAAWEFVRQKSGINLLDLIKGIAKQNAPNS